MHVAVLLHVTRVIPSPPTQLPLLAGLKYFAHDVCHQHMCNTSGFLRTAPTANWWQLWWRMVNEATKNLGLTLLWFVRGCGMVWSDGQLSYCLGYLWWKRKPLAGFSSMQVVTYSSWCTGSSHSGCQQSVCWPSVHTNQSIALEEIVTCDYTWLSDD